MINIFRCLWLIAILGGLFFTYSLRIIYSDFSEFIWMNLAIMVVAFAFIVFCFRRFAASIWIPVAVIGSFIIGLLPYRFGIPRIKGLLSNSDAKLSIMFQELPRALGVVVDGFFYIFITFLLLLLAKLVLPQTQR